jgi:hypothetical protein
VRSKSWSKDDMTATDAAFWGGEHWDGSEAIMIRSRTFPCKLPNSSHVDLISVSTLKTITMTFQGAYSAYIISVQGSEGNVATFFGPLAIIGWFRLQSAFWLSDEGTYFPLGSLDTPVTTTPLETQISKVLHSTRSWRGVGFRTWWICSITLLGGFAIF